MNLEVASVAGIALVQDAGRAGHMHEGVPPGGALVPELLARANAAVRNALGETAIELFGSMTIVARGSSACLIATDSGVARTCSDGESFACGSDGGRVCYVAVRGGIDVAPVLGGRGTLVVARLGGHEGRALRRGDVLRIGRSPPHDPQQQRAPDRPDATRPIRVVPGPDLDRFPPSALDVLLSSTFTVDPRSDRVGLRLAGPRIPRLGPDDAPSAPMVRGAIQVPASGQPIVLGPDHPTTGGYPVLATVVRGDFGALALRGDVIFALASHGTVAPFRKE